VKLLVLVCMVMTCVIFAPARADTVLYSTGFESPAFTAGNVSGQDGWSTYQTPDASQVEAGVAKTGSQAVDVLPALATSNQTGPYHTNAVTGALVDLSADIYLASSSTETSWQFAGLGPGLAGYLGGIDISRNTGTITLITAGAQTVGTFSRDSWQHVDLLFDIPAQTYDLSINNTLLASNVPFCGSNGLCTGAVLNTYADGFFDTFAGVTNENDIGYMDNFTVTLVTTPEPSTAGLMLGGILLAGLGLNLRTRRLARS
jgi:hypothetical protein